MDGEPEQRDPEAPAREDPDEDRVDSWESLAERLGNVLSAEQSGGQPGSLAGTPVSVEPTGLPQLDRIASLAEQLEGVLSNPPDAAYNASASPQKAFRAEDMGLAGPTAIVGSTNPAAAWHSGEGLGLTDEATPTFPPSEPPAYEGSLAGFQAEPAPQVELPSLPPRDQLQEDRPPVMPKAAWETYEPPAYEHALAGLQQPVEAAPLTSPSAVIGSDRPLRDGLLPEVPAAAGSPAASSPPLPAFDSAPVPDYGDFLAGGQSPVVEGVSFLGGSGGSPQQSSDLQPGGQGVPTGQVGGFAQTQPPVYEDMRLGGLPGVPSVEYPRLAGGGEENPQAPAGGRERDEDGQGGVIAELRDAVDGLRQVVASMSKQSGAGSRERAGEVAWEPQQMPRLGVIWDATQRRNDGRNASPSLSASPAGGLRGAGGGTGR